ncbi:hypothetical protein E2320_009916 [Naja naja]|nr:hypothetical protein E2320_009916 [Naja naja]
MVPERCDAINPAKTIANKLSDYSSWTKEILKSVLGSPVIHPNSNCRIKNCNYFIYVIDAFVKIALNCNRKLIYVYLKYLAVSIVELCCSKKIFV